MSLELSTVLIVACCLVVEGTAAQSVPERPLRVLLISEKHAGAAPATEETKITGIGDLFEDEKLFDRRAVEYSGLTAGSLDGTDVVVLEAVGEGLTAKRAEELYDSVMNGTGLVVCGAAARALPESETYCRLLGRRRAAASGGGRASSKVTVAVLDQRHPVTQSLTHFHHGGALWDLETADSARVLAGAIATSAAPGDPPAKLRPVVWTVSHGRGRVLVSLLDSATGESRGLAGALLSRGAQWTARSPITVVAGGSFRLLSESLGPDEEGLVPGRPPMKGFYRGRRVARFMTFHGASWLTRSSREKEEQPDRVVDSLGIRPGQSAVDLGAGNGYFTLRLARKVGPRGRVLAVDIQKEMLELLKERARKQGLHNIEPILAGPTDPRLPEGVIDVVLLVDVYHELSEPASVMAAVRRSLKKDGRVVLVEYRGEDPGVPIKPLHRMFARQAIAELTAQGFRWIETKKFLPWQHILVFGLANK